MFTAGQVSTADIEESPSFSGYLPLDAASREIRLLRILAGDDNTPVKCELEYYPIDYAPDYHALSYFWGKPGNTYRIVVDDKIVMVRQNVGDFLRNLRLKHGEILVWADMLCINQRDVTERGAQVELMGEIFGKAKMVQAWLGVSTPDIDLALSRASELERGFQPWGDMITNARQYWQEIGSCRIRPALRDLFLRPYWTRLWIIRELVLAQDITFVCGSSSVSHEHLRQACDIYELTSYDTDNRQFSSGWFTFDKVNDNRKEKMPTMGCAFAFFKMNECTNPKDKVYALRQLFPRPEVIPVDYSKSVIDLFMDTLRAGLLDEGFGLVKVLLKSLGETADGLSASLQGSATDFVSLTVREGYRVDSCQDVALWYKPPGGHVGFYVPQSSKMSGLDELVEEQAYVQQGDFVCDLGVSRSQAVLRRVSLDTYDFIGYMQYDIETVHLDAGDAALYGIGLTEATDLKHSIISINRKALAKMLKKEP